MQEKAIALAKKYAWAGILCMLVFVIASEVTRFLIELFLTGGEAGWEYLVAVIVGALPTLAVGRRMVKEESELEPPPPPRPRSSLLLRILHIAQILYPQQLEKMRQILRVLRIPSSATPQPAAKPPSRVFSDKSPQTLVALGEGLTSAQAESITKLHLGTWLRVYGTVFDVVEQKDEVLVLLSAGDGPGLFLYFDKSWWDRLKLLSEKKGISVVGQIASIDKTMIHLKNCELPETDS